MKNIFEVAAGSITGRDHIMFSANKSNQDAFYYVVSDDLIVAAVCDGCGSGAYSEVGSRVGARLTVETVSLLASRNIHLEEDKKLQDSFWKKIELDILAQLRVLANAMGGSFYKTVEDYFLFTIVGVLITKESTVLFSFGDGVFFLNEEMVKIDSFPNNAPPYLAYNLLNPEIVKTDSNVLRFQINKILPTENVASILLGSDGVVDLDLIKDKCLPGRTDIVGPVSQFWDEDKFFKNPDMIRRRLALINNEMMKINWASQCVEKSPGLLRDDTTMIVIRRRKEG